MKIILLLLLLASIVRADFNSYNHFAYTYSCNLQTEQYIGVSVFTVNPEKIGGYVNLKNSNTNISNLNIGLTKRLGNNLAVYGGAGYLTLNQDATETAFQAVGGVIVNFAECVYLEAGYESYKQGLMIGFGITGILSGGK